MLCLQDLTNRRTFTESAELLRAKGKILPQSVHRMFWEKSAVLSSHMAQENLIIHNAVPNLLLLAGHAFQGVAPLDSRHDLTKERVERHFVTNMKDEPTPSISTQKSLSK